nr:hypothetical protein [Tanacetum cinerariifolium]
MLTPKFADVYNLVAFLSKPTVSEGFEKIIDFLKVNPVKYALTVNPTIYTSCIEQFWATATAKNINREAQIHAKVDGKKVIISEATIRRDLKFKDKGVVDCLSNEVIFEQILLMGYENLSHKLTFYKAFFFQQWKFLIHTILQCLSAKTTAWNEFSSTMASAITCLATNQKFNFSKYIFDSMVFSNMKRVEKDFSGRDTPLFPTMIVQAQEELGEDNEIPTDTQHTPTIIQPTTSQRQRKQKPRNIRRKDTQLPQISVPTKVVADEAVYKEMYDSVERAACNTPKLGRSKIWVRGV